MAQQRNDSRHRHLGTLTEERDGVWPKTRLHFSDPRTGWTVEVRAGSVADVCVVAAALADVLAFAGVPAVPLPKLEALRHAHWRHQAEIRLDGRPVDPAQDEAGWLPATDRWPVAAGDGHAIGFCPAA